MKPTLTTLFLAANIALVAAPGCGSSNEQVDNAPTPDAGDAGAEAADTSDSEVDGGSDAAGDSEPGDDGAAQDAAKG